MAVVISGNLQPDVFRKYISEIATNGLIQRFIPAILDSKKTKRGDRSKLSSLNEEAEKWDMTLRKIYAVPKQILAGWVAPVTEDYSNNKNTWAVNPSV